MLKDFMLTDYFTEVYADVETILDEETPDSRVCAVEALEKRKDEITGEITGSYVCNSTQAKEKVLNEFGLFYDAVEWYNVSTAEVGEWFLYECWENMDVLVRQYIFDYTISEMLDMYGILAD